MCMETNWQILRTKVTVAQECQKLLPKHQIPHEKKKQLCEKRGYIDCDRKMWASCIYLSCRLLQHLIDDSRRRIWAKREIRNNRNIQFCCCGLLTFAAFLLHKQQIVQYWWYWWWLGLWQMMYVCVICVVHRGHIQSYTKQNGINKLIQSSTRNVLLQRKWNGK